MRFCHLKVYGTGEEEKLDTGFRRYGGIIWGGVENNVISQGTSVRLPRLPFRYGSPGWLAMTSRAQRPE